MYLNHVTLSTGHTRRSPRAEVSDETIKALQPWLKAALADGKDAPLPGDLGASYSASLTLLDGSLNCTIKRGTVPLVQFAVAKRSRHTKLWPLLAGLAGKPDLPEPGTPWVAVRLLPGLQADLSATDWLGDFERCVGWTWLKEAAQWQG